MIAIRYKLIVNEGKLRYFQYLNDLWKAEIIYIDF